MNRRGVGAILSWAGLWLFFLVRYPDGSVGLPPMVAHPEFYALCDLAFPLWVYPILLFMILKNMKIGKILKELQARKIQVAVVVDEYGGNIGIVTMEDLLEELVGDIIDEYDKDEFILRNISKNLYLTKAQTRIMELNRHFNTNIPQKNYETVGGLLLHLFERIPQKGDKIKYENLTFIIKEASSTKINWVLIRVKEEMNIRKE